jgi:nicotinate-nucleotide--dimethylbenzimidazole phosphoribosyltransferase
LAAAGSRIPIVLDGLISTAAGLLAATLAPAARSYFFAGHLSPEPGHAIALDFLGLTPILDLRARLGEGSGAGLAVPILVAAAETLASMAELETVIAG